MRFDSKSEDLSYNLHSRRELAEDDHRLHVSRELEASVLEIHKVAQHFGYCGSRMQAGGDGRHKESTEFSIGGADTGGTVILLEVVPDLLDRRKVSNSGLDRGGDMQGNITERLLVVLIPGVELISGTRSTENEPLALGPEVGLHGSMPLLPVGASGDGDHFVESAGHGSKSCCEVNKVSK